MRVDNQSRDPRLDSKDDVWIIEATATTRLYGFKDDVVIRVTADGDGSRVDVRSVSRVGESDLGKNAKRVREYLARLKS